MNIGSAGLFITSIAEPDQGRHGGLPPTKTCPMFMRWGAARGMIYSSRNDTHLGAANSYAMRSKRDETSPGFSSSPGVTVSFSSRSSTWRPRCHSLCKHALLGSHDTCVARS
ncbi:hypothetical protein BH23CHL4_BH23CHL4_28840 [soil metagenome]